MRLSDRERETVRQAAKDCFEPDAVLRLFGSRLRDARKGGDIDLLIETSMIDAAQIAKAHHRFLSQVYAHLGEQRIDLLIDYMARQQRMPIYEIAHVQGVVL
jgi:predicted nucleotidyltransferase